MNMSVGNLEIRSCYFPTPTLRESASEQGKKIKEIFSSFTLMAKGSYGSIFKVTDLLDSQDYALKLASGVFGSKHQLLNEVEKLKVLNQEQTRESNKYVPDLIAYFEFADRRVAMQLPLYRKDLFPEERNDQLSLKQTFPFLKTMFEILCFLKRHNVVHLDIKPENIFLTCDGKYILGDFGTSIFRGDSKEGDYPGTVVYAAPEVIISSKFSDFPSDMWSTAVTVCMVYGGIYLFGEPDDCFNSLEKLVSVSKIQQRRFEKQYPEELQESAREKGLQERFSCDPSTFSQVRPFDMKMEQECRPNEEDLESFHFLLSLLHKMFDFDRNTRITPEDALVELSHIEA